MDLVKLNNGLQIPCIGFGTYPQKEKLLTSIPAFLDEGGTLIDTSDNYENESYVNTALKSSEHQAEAFIISKFSQPARTSELEKCFEESRNRLGEHLNLYMLHWPYPFLWKKAWRRMEKLYLEGKCQGIGVCNFDVETMKELLDFCRVKPVINQIERHPMFQQNEVVDFCKQNDIQIMCYSPMARKNENLVNHPVICGIASKNGVSPTQVILRWNVQNETIPIPSSSSAIHIHENYHVFDFSLSDTDMEEIDGLESGMRVRHDPKTRFSAKKKSIYAMCSLLDTLHLPVGSIFQTKRQS